MSAVRYVIFDGKAVSYEQGLILTAARKDGVNFRLNSGRRSIPEQWVLYRNQPPVAAYPNDNAPHILTGRWWHALDIDAIQGGAERFRKWAASKGVTYTYSVRGEPWHLQVGGISATAVRAKFAAVDPFDFTSDREDRLIPELAMLRATAARRGKWLIREKARAGSIKTYLRVKIRALRVKRNLSGRERKRLGYLRDALAGRKLEA